MPGATNYPSLLAELGSHQFTALRPAQEDTLRRYAAQHATTRDLAIELPTGAGKSLIALLISEAWLREGKKVAILTGNKTLARQMEREAQALGLDTVRMEGQRALIPPLHRRRYQRAQAVAVMNYWVYFNQNPVIDPADLLIMDDAHLAEHCLHSLYSVEVDCFEHKLLFDTLVNELAGRFPEYAVLQDALDPEAPSIGRAEPLSFLDQSLAANRIREIIDGSTDLAKDADLKFRWMRLRDRLNETIIYLSKRSLWLRPYVYPLTRNEYYERPEQCLYMSATIGDTADLARRLGTRPVEMLQLDAVHSETTYGRRWLVMNSIEDADIPPRLSDAILAALRVHPKALWLCASTSEAGHLRKVVERWLNENGIKDHAIWTLTSLGDEIEEFKRASSGHLFVAGRFDGMDFKADECRLVVVATLPKAINIQEEFFTAYLRDAEFMVRRLNQRIVQALGRCNRSAEDFGVYVLADRRFATHFGREANRLNVPRNIIAEIDAAEDMTQVPVEELAERITAFLRQDFTEYDRDIEEHRAALPANHGPNEQFADSADSEVQGWAELFWSQNYAKAQGHFADCSQAAGKTLRELGAFFQWSEAKAAFLRGQQGEREAQVLALDLLEQSIERGGRSPWFNRLRSSLNRYVSLQGASRRLVAPALEYPEILLQVFDDRLERFNTRGPRFQRWIDGLTSKLNSVHHAEYLDGLEQLGGLLGYSATRPAYDGAIDCQWRGTFGNTREVVTFEAKIEHLDAASITLHFVGQAHNQVTRARERFSTLGYTIRGTIVTHLVNTDPAARASLGELRIVHKAAVLELWRHIVTVLSQYREHWSLQDLDARSTAAERTIPKLPSAGWLTRALSHEGPFITGLSSWMSGHSKGQGVIDECTVSAAAVIFGTPIGASGTRHGNSATRIADMAQLVCRFLCASSFETAALGCPFSRLSSVSFWERCPDGSAARNKLDGARIPSTPLDLESDRV